VTRTRYAIVGGGIIGVERQRLTDIDDRSRRNGVPGIRRLDTAELREIEPHVRGVAGLHLERGLVYPMPDPRFAPSPAATSSLAIAEHLVDLVLDRQGAA